jgi:AbrB family looped-hinge helix DNA binding protein
MTQIIEVARRGQITIPKSVRDRFGIEDGHKYDFRALEGGVLVLTPKPAKAAAALSELRETLIARGATLEEMMKELRSLRETDGG